MSASLLNLSALAAPGQAVAGAGQAAAKGPLAGFEALMAAFFGEPGQVPAAEALAAPQAGAMAQETAAALPGPGVPAPLVPAPLVPAPAVPTLAVPALAVPALAVPALVGPAAEAVALPGVVQAKVALDSAATDADLPAQDQKTDAEACAEANLALIGALAVQTAPVAAPAAPPPAAPVAAPQVAPPAQAAAAAPPAWGREKPAGTPAEPALLHSAPQAELAAKAAPQAPEALPETAEAPLPPQATLEPGRGRARQESGPAPSPDRLAALPPVATAAASAAAPAPVAAPQPALPQAALPQAAQPQAEPAPAAAAVQQAEAPLLAAEPLPAAPAPAPPAPAPARDRSARSERAEAGRAPGPRTQASAAAPGQADPRGPAFAPLGEALSEAPATGAPPVETLAAAMEPEVAAAHEPAVTAQPAPTTEAQAAPAPTLAATPVVRGSPETVANLAAHIIKKLEGRSTRFDVELDPVGFGRVDVRVEINAQGRVTAAMACDNPHAAAELKSRSAELQRALEQAGFDFSGGMRFDVAGEQHRPGQGFAQPEGREPGGGSRGRAFQAALDNAGEADLAAGGLNLRRGLRSAIDVRI